MMNILMVNLPFSGHTNPTLPLTAKLVERGHRVVYVNAPEFREKIERTGAEFVPYSNYPGDASEQYKKTHCFEAAYDTAMALTDTFDVLIYEMFFYPGIDLAKQKGIPAVRQFSQPAWNEDTWKEAPLMFKTSAKLIDMQVLPKKVAKNRGFENICLRDGITKSKPNLNIVYVPENFQNKREEFGDSYIYVIPKPSAQHGNVNIPFEKMKSPIVYISLGSIISDKSFYKKCMKAFGNKEISVILNTGKVEPASLGDIPDNIYAYSFVPQIEVLSHADVFLTHCGMNSINEALCFGVPMVAMPFMNDQITNAKQLVNLGIAKRIHSIVQNTNEIYESVIQVASSNEMKENAMKLKSSIDGQLSWDNIIEKIELLTK
ncbi:MAG: glycosyltransferase [Eubacteriales bacterium]|nr:glycosyltransferase [Eubacteriales bacterium]